MMTKMPTVKVETPSGIAAAICVGQDVSKVLEWVVKIPNRKQRKFYGSAEEVRYYIERCVNKRTSA